MDSRSLSVLEIAAVRPRTHQEYSSTASQFLNFCCLNGLSWENSTGLDAAIIFFFVELFNNGMGVEMGLKLLSAIGHFLPYAGRWGTCKLPRAHRAIAGWKSLRPPKQRLPMPVPVAMAIVGYLILRGPP